MTTKRVLVFTDLEQTASRDGHPGTFSVRARCCGCSAVMQFSIPRHVNIHQLRGDVRCWGCGARAELSADELVAAAVEKSAYQFEGINSDEHRDQIFEVLMKMGFRTRDEDEDEA